MGDPKGYSFYSIGIDKAGHGFMEFRNTCRRIEEVPLLNASNTSLFHSMLVMLDSARSDRHMPIDKWVSSVQKKMQTPVRISRLSWKAQTKPRG